MADSPVFERACAELEQRTAMDRMAARGTVRIGLKEAGLDPRSVEARQMGIVLRKVLPSELEARGVEDAQAVCDEIAELLANTAFDVAADRTSAAEATMARLGS